MQTGTLSDVSIQTALQGRRVAVARAVDDTHTPAEPLLALGAELVYYPCFETLPPEDMAELDGVVQWLTAGEYDWLYLTTASAVMILAERLEHLKLDPGKLANTQIALFGSNTRLAAEDLLHVDIDDLPQAPAHAELLEALPLEPGDTVLLPVPAGYRTTWITTLEERDVRVVSIAAYQTHMGHGGDKLPEMLWSGDVDAIVFTSENNVDFFARRLHYEGGTLAMLDDVCVACIGPRTAAAAGNRGLNVQVEPAEHTPEGLATELAVYFAQRGR